jgi:hypothetical protein
LGASGSRWLPCPITARCRFPSLRTPPRSARLQRSSRTLPTPLDHPASHALPHTRVHRRSVARCQARRRPWGSQRPVPRCSQHSPRLHRCDRTCPSQLGEWATSAPGPPRHGARAAAAEAAVVPSTCAPLRRRGSAVTTAQGQPCRYHGAERIFGEAAQNLGRCSAAQHVATPRSMLQRRSACCNATDHLAALLSMLQPSTACCNTVLNPPAGSRGNASTTALTVSVVSGGKSAPRCRTSRRYSGGSTARTPR